MKKVPVKPTKLTETEPEKRSAAAGKKSFQRVEIWAVWIVLLISVGAGSYYYLQSRGLVGSSKSESSLEQELSEDGQDLGELVPTGSNIPKGANIYGKPRPATKDCEDRHAECVSFRNNGECTKNPGWMIVSERPPGPLKTRSFPYNNV